MGEIGRVVLVGAGPGGPGLLTVAALDVLRAADVVFYDRLAGPAFRRFVRPTTELVDVGKQPGRHDVTQERIIDRLLSEAASGRVVVRVKGGDPLVFGRGFEEAVACSEAGIPVQVVPGITSAIAAPEVAGIPLTHRGLPPVVTVLSGHETPDKGRTSVDWQHMAGTPGPLVVLMGVRNLPGLVESLIAGGKDPETPVAAVQSATTRDERVIHSRLAAAPGDFLAAGVRSPAIIVVGENVSFAGRALSLRQAPEITSPTPVSRGLLGWRVIVPRSRTGASMLTALLRGEGAEVVEVPVRSHSAVADDDRLRAFMGALLTGEVGIVAVGSAMRVEWLVRTLRRFGKDVRALSGTELLATGPGAGGAFDRYGLTPAADVDAIPADGRLAVVIGEVDAEERFERVLADAGWEVQRVDVVSATDEAIGDDMVDALSRADAVVFPSSGTVRSYRRAGCPVPPIVACVGPETAHAAVESGILVDVVPQRRDLVGLVDALVRHAASRA